MGRATSGYPIPEGDKAWIKSRFTRLGERVSEVKRLALANGRALSPILVGPGRLGPAAVQVTDWNDATEAGFYWSTSGADHQPYSSTWQGHVDVGQSGRVVQTLTNRLTPGLSWKRSRNVPNVLTSFNGQPDPLGSGEPRGYVEYLPRWSFARTTPTTGAPNGGDYARFTAAGSQDSSGRGFDIYANPDFGDQNYAQALRLRPVWEGEAITIEVWVRSSKALQFRIETRIHDGFNFQGWLAATSSGSYVSVPANTWTKLTRTITPTHTGFLAAQVAAASGVALVAGDTIDGAQFGVSYSKGEWTEWRRSDNILIPAKCVGGTGAAQVLRTIDMQTGRYNFSTGDKYFAMDGIFTDEFREYEVYAEWGTGTTNGGGVRFRQDGGEIAPASGYNYQALWGTGGSVAAQRGGGNQGSFPPEGAQGFQARIRFVNPSYARGAWMQKRTHGHWASYQPNVVADVDSSLIAYDQQILDGFSIYISDQALAGVISSAYGFMYVRGIA
jgi:hypothetical protein